MRGVVFLGERKLEIQEFPDPTPGPGEVVLSIKASGMCGSDLKFYRAAGNETAALGLGGTGKPVIAGHEPCGVIAAVWSRRRPDGEPSRARLSAVPMNARYCSNVMPDANRSGVTTLSFRSIIATPLGFTKKLQDAFSILRRSRPRR